jgi:hypothetical protein
MYPLRVEYDETNDIVQIGGHRFSGDYFRYFTPQNVEKHGRLFEIVKMDTQNEIIVVRNFYLDGLLRFIVNHWPRKYYPPL